jgi:hypothetical protein
MFMPSFQTLKLGVLVGAALISVATTGCVGASEGEEEATGESTQELRGRGRVPHPQGVYFADVNANGTGCPAGTWDVAISEDGETFTLRFGSYEAQVSPGIERDVKDCTLDINLGSPEGLSYSVGSFYYQGYVLLDQPGMKARQTANYSFRGDHENNVDRNEVTGPIDESYVYADEIGAGRRAWSPCRRDDTLRVATRLVIKNNREKTGTGYVNSATVDGSLAFKWKVQWRRCRGGDQRGERG